MTDARTIISKLRDGGKLTDDELRWFSAGLASGAVSDAQAGAFAMAVCLNGLDAEGRASLTLGMRDSGDLLNWALNGPVIDKHSTGGLGDCLSLILAPALAACGAYVPMLSGRGLGHTGGTLDKMEAIPGYRAIIGNEELARVVREVGCAIVGASGEIAPADKRLYAVRDVTSTVESVDLITASILSKKLSEGLEGLVLDVKTGSGAFMATPEDALALAQSLVDTAQGAGCRCTALLTDMNQPLAPAMGNALEVAEVMKALTGEEMGPLVQITAALGGVLLTDAGLVRDVQEGADKIAATIRDGRAAVRFGRMIAKLDKDGDGLLSAEEMPDRPDRMMRLDTDATRQFFETFFALPAPTWSVQMRSDVTPRQVVGVMTRMFVSATWSLRRRLMSGDLRRLASALRS